MTKIKISKLDKLAIYISKLVGSMPFFFFCCVLVFIPFFLPSSLSIVQFISSGFLQLILLPIMVINQNIASKISDMETRDNFREDIKLDKQDMIANDQIIKLLKKLDKKINIDKA